LVRLWRRGLDDRLWLISRTSILVLCGWLITKTSVLVLWGWYWGPADIMRLNDYSYILAICRYVFNYVLALAAILDEIGMSEK
jgi:hypothetical protein